MTGWRDDLLLLVTNAVYGTGYAAQREALADLPPGLLGFARLALAGLVLAPFLPRSPATREAPGDRLKIFWMGALGFGAAYALSNVGLARSTATNAALLITMEPIAVMLLSPLALGAIFLNVQPIVGVALGVGMLGEPATIDTGSGTVLVLGGLALTTRRSAA